MRQTQVKVRELTMKLELGETLLKRKRLRR